MISVRTRSFTAILFLFFAAGRFWGQATPTPTPIQTTTNDQTQRADDSDHASLAPPKLLRNLAEDQKDIWTSPFKARTRDLNWLLPLTGVTVGLINADSELSSRLSTTDTLGKRSGTLSNA